MFIAPDGVPRKTRFVAGCFVICGVTQILVLSRVPIRTDAVAIGSLLYICGLNLLLAAFRANRRRLLSVAFSEDVPEHLVLWGPYRYVRHPYYVSYCMTWLAGFAATGNAWMAGTLLLMLILYLWAARLEERKFLNSSYAAAYEHYQRTTGMFLPRLWPSSTLNKSHTMP
jgi:protein-S-isoprenylcysteine O-methyltransferase Ste14